MIEGDNIAAIEFLKQWAPEGPWVLNAIDPERKKGLIAQTFDPKTVRECHAFLKQWNGVRNLYFMVNTPRKYLNTKADKEDVGYCVAFHVDVDPAKGADIPAEQDRILTALQTYTPRPSVILFSGGGYQGFWLLAEPVEIDPVSKDNPRPWETLEALNRGFEKGLGGDHCFNIDRIMRLPGTVNLPDAKKLKAGRVPALACLVSSNWELLYKPADFKPWEEKKTKPAKATKAVKAIPDHFPLPEWAQRVLENGPDHEGPRSYNNDRSKAVWAVCCAMARANWSKEDIVEALLNPDHKASEHVNDQSDPTKYAERQADKALEHAGGGFVYNAKGAIATMQFNIRLALAKLSVIMSYDEFAHKAMVEGPEGLPLRIFNDEDQNFVYLAVDEAFGFRPAFEYFKMVMDNEARAKGFHPVRKYLDSLKWDGVERIDCWLTNYAGMEDTEYVQAVGSLMLVGAVRRIRQPGCKFDEMLILIGEQGINKSTALRLLAVNDDWFTDTMSLNMTSQQTIEQLSGKWIVEISELKGMRAADLEHIKSFCSRQTDRARLSYGRIPTEVPRQSIFFASTNSELFLKDITGNRRFWPVKVSRIDIVKLKADRDQLWAEAVAREAKGQSIRLPEHLWGAAGIEQAKRVVDDPWIELFQKVLGGNETTGKIVCHDMWAVLNIPEGMRTQNHKERLGESMRALQWGRKQLRINKELTWCYIKGDKEDIATRILLERDSNGKLNVFRWVDGSPHPMSNDPRELNGSTSSSGGHTPGLDDDIPF